MSKVRVISTASLRQRLEETLGRDSLLFQRFEVALRCQDEASINDAMNSMRLYPDEVRAKVEEALLSWLFNQTDSSGVNDLPAASDRVH